MIGERIIDKKPVNLTEVKQLLAGKKKEKDLSYEQDITLKYAKKFSKLSLSQAKKLESELKQLEGLLPAMIVKIVDILPEKKERARPANIRQTDSCISYDLPSTALQ